MPERSGAGGSVGFADPEHEIGFGYVMNRTETDLVIDPRAQALIDAVYDAIGRAGALAAQAASPDPLRVASAARAGPPCWLSSRNGGYTGTSTTTTSPFGLTSSRRTIPTGSSAAPRICPSPFAFPDFFAVLDPTAGVLPRKLSGSHRVTAGRSSVGEEETKIEDKRKARRRRAWSLR
jgi:hypothetical protein